MKRGQFHLHPHFRRLEKRGWRRVGFYIVDFRSSDLSPILGSSLKVTSSLSMSMDEAAPVPRVWSSVTAFSLQGCTYPGMYQGQVPESDLYSTTVQDAPHKANSQRVYLPQTPRYASNAVVKPKVHRKKAVLFQPPPLMPRS